MKRCLKKLFIILGILTLFVSNVAYAHSGRTDANGGHRDNKNKSGLGSYHYHCGGYPAHLHPNGICPYTSSSSSDSKNNSNSNSSPLSSQTSTPASTAINAEHIETNESDHIMVNTLENKNSISNTMNNSSENSNAFVGIITLGAIAGGSYWMYKKHKREK